MKVKLTDRELEVLRLIADGYASKEIVDILFLSIRAVENRRNRILIKCGAQSMCHAIAIAFREGWIK